MGAKATTGRLPSSPEKWQLRGDRRLNELVLCSLIILSIQMISELWKSIISVLIGGVTTYYLQTPLLTRAVRSANRVSLYNLLISVGWTLVGIFFILLITEKDLRYLAAIALSVVLITIVYRLMATMTGVDDRNFLLATIEADAVSLTMSENVRAKNPRVVALAARIAQQRREEIDEVDNLLNELERS